MRINSEAFGADIGLDTWLDAEIPRFKKYNYSFRAFPGIRVAENCKSRGKGEKGDLRLERGELKGMRPET